MALFQTSLTGQEGRYRWQLVEGLEEPCHFLKITSHSHCFLAFTLLWCPLKIRISVKHKGINKWDFSLWRHLFGAQTTPVPPGCSIRTLLPHPHHQLRRSKADHLPVHLPIRPAVCLAHQDGQQKPLLLSNSQRYVVLCCLAGMKCWVNWRWKIAPLKP